ncbi:hypothetical protein [Owenweeksia hongkongensis]
MNDVSKAIQVALSVRQYLQENTGGAMPNSKEIVENYQRITQQIKNLGEL